MQCRLICVSCLATRSESRCPRMALIRFDASLVGVWLRETGMSKKLFVGGLAWATTTDGLRKAFEQFGEVSDAKVITDRDTGRSRGFGFVTFSDDSAATSAITAMDGRDLDGRSIRVNEANQTQGQGGGGGGGGGRGGGGRGSRRDGGSRHHYDYE